MKKIIITLVCCCLTSIYSVKKCNAINIDEKNTINVLDVINNPDEYPSVEMKKYSYEEYKDVIENDDNLSESEKNRMIQKISTLQKSRNSTYDYWTFRDTCKVTINYSCYPYFYVYTNFGGPSHEPSEFIKILNANINRNYNGVSKQFGGTLYYNLENSKTIYWDVNGDFYNNGTTTAGGGIEVGIKESATIKFSISGSSNHFSYCNKTGRIKI